MKKYLAEFIGTFILIFIGCGTAMLVGTDAESGSGYLITAVAFGLALVAVSYSLGNISGGHVNPAVSLAVLIDGGLTGPEFAGYAGAQLLGAFAGSGSLALIFTFGGIEDLTGGFAVNSAAGVGGSIIAALVVEFIATFIFVMVIMGVNSELEDHLPLAGLISGLALTAVHIGTMGYTGTSVNPARSLGPAIVAAVLGNTENLLSLIAFIIGPFLGAVAAAFLYRILESEDEKPEKSVKRKSAKNRFDDDDDDDDDY
ncbi:MAG: aquaporin [Lachnospiraceae bacterium]|nr:aquaporin [Lachnospiraceae bacterium]